MRCRVHGPTHDTGIPCREPDDPHASCDEEMIARLLISAAAKLREAEAERDALLAVEKAARSIPWGMSSRPVPLLDALAALDRLREGKGEGGGR